jgi:lipoyl(octanoyl) transferase 2
MSLPSIFYHHFPLPLPYARTLALQQQLHQIQLAARRNNPASHKDLLLLLQHRPVYTSGRRQTEDDIAHERARLTHLGADFVTTQRGGEITYHGPGQIVGYPLLDLSRYSPSMGIRDYICRMRRTIETLLNDAYGVNHVPSEHTGVFLDPQTKVGSIGVQVRHRLTSHGFAFNVTREPIAWFDRVVACGLADVKAGCISSASGRDVSVAEVIPIVVDIFGRVYGRRMEKLDLDNEGEIGMALKVLEEAAQTAGSWKNGPAKGQLDGIC